MFTPQEVSEKTFPKVSFGGYGMSAVDEFLDTLTEDYSALYKENATLKAKLKVLAEKVEEYRATEDAMRSTLLTAQRMAAQMVQDAQNEKENVLASARAAAAEQVGLLDAQRADAQKKLAMAQHELADFIRRSQELCAAQAEFLAKLPEMELAEETPAGETEAQAEENAVQQIGEDIVRHFAEEETAPQEQPDREEAPAAPVQKAAAEATGDAGVEEVPLSEAFRLDLDELKFGRNYTAE